MQLRSLPIEAAVGHILCHNLADARGRKAFTKGRVIQPQDLPRMRELGLHELRVAVLDDGDCPENDAAERLSTAIAGSGITHGPARTGRVHLRATRPGPLSIATEALHAINELDGLSVATLHNHTTVRPGDTLATIKIIPFAVPEQTLRQAEAIGAGSLLQVLPIVLHQIGVILVSSPAARRRIEAGMYPAIAGRVSELQGRISAVQATELDPTAISTAITALRQGGAELLIIAGETSIIDRDDLVPQAIVAAGGHIEHFGAPVEPGNLLLIGYIDSPQTSSTRPLPIIGAPGCVRSRDTNIVDLLLSRLMAGTIIRRHDIIALGHGGLLT
jgi:molybdenum cofactor cytidylyltransferase